MNTALAALAAFAAVLGASGPAAAAIIGLGGSSMTGWTPNSNSGGVPAWRGRGTIADVLTITTATNGLATSYWFNTPQNVTNFVESFTYTGVSGGADGAAVGRGRIREPARSEGEAATWDTPASLRLRPCQSTSSTETRSAAPTTAPFRRVIRHTQQAPGVNVASGHAINVTLGYKESDGALTETMTDTVTAATYTRVWRGVGIQGRSAPRPPLSASPANRWSERDTDDHELPVHSGGRSEHAAHIAPIAVTGFNQNMIFSADPRQRQHHGHHGRRNRQDRRHLL